MLKIVNAPNPVLSEKAKKISVINKATSKLIDNMKEALEVSIDPVGVGLAAPQVGKSLQIFIAKPSPRSKILVFINPKITKKANISVPTQKEPDKNKDDHKKLEGCLSLKDVWGEVERYDSVWVSYLDEKGKKHQRRFDGFLSIIIQHEIDHLHGVLFPKRVLEQGGTLYKSEKDEKGRDVFEEIKI